MKHPLNESAWRRGRQGTWAGWKNPLFGIFDVAGSGVVGAIFGWYWGVGLFLFVMFVVWVGATASAPIKQRNEARALVLAKPKIIPLQNRKELIGAIANVENKTMQLINRENALGKMDSSSYIVDTKAFGLKQAAYKEWSDALDELRRQYLVAGDEYERIVVGFIGFVMTIVITKMGFMEYRDDATKSVVTKDTVGFAGALGAQVKEAIRKIDELSEQASHKGDSQTERV